LTDEQKLADLAKIGKETVDLFSFRKLEVCLGLPRNEIRSIASRAGGFYDPFPKKQKVRPFQQKFKPHKVRTIDNPIEPLKSLQKEINDRILRKVALPDYVYGGVKGKRVLDNVLLHFGSRALVTMDIRSFFPSITNLQVFRVWRNDLNCSPRIASLLTTLTTIQRRLPQGACTSTTLANLVLSSIYCPIQVECEKQGVLYSTWVDDLAFSGSEARQVIQVPVETLRGAGFSVSRRKLKVMGPADRKILTGVLMSRFPSVVPEYLSQLRAGIHRLLMKDVDPSEMASYIRSLEGRIAHVASIVPLKSKKLLRDLENAKRACRAA